MKEQITELRPAPPVETYNLAIEHGRTGIRRSYCLAEAFK